MDPVTSNFIINIIGISVGSLIALIGSLSACLRKSRCTSISTPCMSCDRQVLDENTSEGSETPGLPPIPRPRI